jgi:hypothetical protein
MSSAPNDFRVEVIKSRPQGLETFDLGPVVAGEVVDITSRVLRDGMGSVNRATDRDLLSFKTGDMTMALKNGDGYFDDLFAFLTATTIWGCRVYRRGAVQFYGVIIGKGSITFDRKVKTCEITVYGLTKILDMTTAEGTDCKRVFQNPITNPYTLNGSHGAGSTTLTLTTGAEDFETGDTLHLTDHANAEDVTVKRIASATSVELEAATVHLYASLTPVVCSTPFFRYKTISYLATQLFKQAGIALSELRISPSQFNTLAPTPQNLTELPAFAAGNPVYTNPAQRSGREYITQLVNGTKYQTSPDVGWTVGDATIRAWVDWSKYYLQSDTGPAIVPRTPNTAESVKGGDPHNQGYDLRTGTMICYQVNTATKRLQKATTVTEDGWGAFADVTTPDVPGMATPGSGEVYGCDYDPVRDEVLVYGTNGATFILQLYSVSGTSWSSCLQADDVGATLYGGFSYCRDLQCFIGLRGTSVLGTVFDIVAFRGASRLWKRSFPGVLIQTNGTNSAIYPTDSIRYVNGKLYTVAVTDGEAQLIVSADQFVTYTARSLAATTGTSLRTFGARVNNAYVIAAYSGTVQRALLYAAPFYAGVVSYADFTGLSVAEGLKKLSILTNSLFFLDDDLQGHFVARDLYDSGAVLDVTTLEAEQSDVFLWDQAVQYVSASGNGVEAVSGNNAFAADGIELTSDFLPNEAFAQSLADAYYAFYSAQRKYLDASFHDVDGHIYRPLDRVVIGAERFLVYESDHDLTGDSVSVQLLEDR